jgi:hypothetical protein
MKMSKSEKVKVENVDEITVEESSSMLDVKVVPEDGAKNDTPTVKKTKTWLKNPFKPTDRPSLYYVKAEKAGFLTRLARRIDYQFIRNDREKVTKKIDALCVRNLDVRRILENQIKSVPIFRAAKAHTHPESAGERSGANVFLQKLATQAGYEPYNVSMSKQDILNGQVGSRNYFTPKDYCMEARHDKVTINTCFIFTDVDFNVDMNKYLRYFKPILMYTVVPTSAGCQDKEFAFYFKDNKIHYSVQGGSKYVHQLWDYCGDVVTVVDKHKNLLCYHITQHILKDSPHRRIITILPFCSVPFPYYKMNEQCPLRRKVLTSNGVSFIDCETDNKLSLAIEGSSDTILISKKTYKALQIKRDTATTPLKTGDIEFILYKNAEDKRDITNDACILYNILMSNCKLTPNMIDTNVIPTHFQTMSPLVHEEVKPPCQVVTSPLVTHPALVPAQTYNNEVAAIAGRVDKPRNDTKMPLKYQHYSNEFAKMMIPVPHQGRPISMEEVIKLQNKPMQRARIREVDHILGPEPRNKLKSFVKPEAYSAPNDPRVITTNAAVLTTRMSAYTYAAKEDFLKKLDFYGPCKTPMDVHDRMKMIGSNGLIISDYNRFDGSISRDLQFEVVNKIYSRWLNLGRDRDEWLAMFHQVFIQKAYTRHGYPYDPGFGTRSGSPITTDGNTMINAFISYSALREIGFEPEEAWSRLGLYVGDDGLNQNLPGLARTLNEVVNDLGLNIEIVQTTPDESITFAGRTFPRPLTSNTSHQDIERTLPKLHVSANKCVTPAEAAYNRAAGYYVTDKETPLIGTWARKVLFITGKLEDFEKTKDRDELIKDSMTSEERYKIANGSWPQEKPELICESIARILNRTTSDINDMVLKIRATETLNTFPVIWNNEESYKPKVTALVNGDLIRPHQNTTCKTESKPIKINSMNQLQDGAPSVGITTSSVKLMKSEPQPNHTSRKALATSTSEARTKSMVSQRDYGHASSNVKPSSNHTNENPRNLRKRNRVRMNHGDRNSSPPYIPNAPEPQHVEYNPRSPVMNKKNCNTHIKTGDRSTQASRADTQRTTRESRDCLFSEQQIRKVAAMLKDMNPDTDQKQLTKLMREMTTSDTSKY